MADNFPSEDALPYNLACYACRLGQLKDAKRWLERAIAISGESDVKLRELKDPDLELLSRKMGEIQITPPRAGLAGVG